jgi:hypothetical protein
MPTSRLSFDRLLVVACLVAAAGPAVSQSVLQFDKWMQRIDQRSQSVQRHLAKRDSVDAISDAHEVGELYRLMAGYFTERGDAADAVKLARDGATLADAVITSVQAEDFDAASRSALSIARACRDCHIQYKPLP